MLIEKSNRIAVVHHWDGDGIASAAIIERIYANRKTLHFIIPQIGLYKADAISIEEVKHFNPDMLLILDYALNREDLNLLEERLGVTVGVVDHHATKPRDKAFCNPIAMGGAEELYPATSYILYKALNPNDFDANIRDLVALGIVGDLNWRDKLDLTNWIPGYSGSLKQLRYAATIIDSCYRLGDYNSIHHARRKLAKDGLKGVVGDIHLESRCRITEDELKKVMNTIKPAERHGSILVFRVETENYITSSIGRELAKRYPNNIVMLVNKVRRLGIDYIYVRSIKHKLRDALKMLRTKGLNVGGKDMVLVVTCRKPKCYEEQEVLSVLKAHLNKIHR